MVRLAKREPFTHVVLYSAAFTGDIDTPLDFASYNVLWVRLVPASTGPIPPSALPSAFDRAGSKWREEVPLARDTDVALVSVAPVRN